MKVPSATVLVRQPFPDLRCGVSGQVVQDDVHLQIARNGRVDLFEEPQHVRTGMAFRRSVSTSPVATFIARTDRWCRCAGSHGSSSRPARASSAATAGCGPMLGTGSFRQSKTRRSLRRIQVEADDIDKLLLEPGSLLTLNVSSFHGLRL